MSFKCQRLPKVLAMVGAVTVAVSVTAACSSSKATDSAKASPSSSAGSESATTAGGSAYAAEQAVVNQYTHTPTSIGQLTPLPKPPPKGLNIVFIQGPDPSMTIGANSFQAAATLLGWKLSIIHYGLTPQSIQSAFNQAIQQHPDAIFSWAAPPQVLTQQLADISSRHIPLIDAYNYYPPGTANLPIANLEDQYRNLWDGKVVADWMIVHTSGHAHVLMLSLPDFPVVSIVPPAVQAELKAVCPATCSFSLLNVAESDIGTDAPSLVVARLVKDPSINYVYGSSGSFLTGVSAAIDTAGLANRVKLISANPTPPDIANILAGKEETSLGVALPMTPWRQIDVLLRYREGEQIPFDAKTINDTGPTQWMPQQWVTPQTWSNPSAPWVQPSDYAQQFAKLWGVSS